MGLARDGAWFSPLGYRLQMPDPSRFTSEGAFNIVFLHELGHVVMHKLDLKRKKRWQTADERYALEEMAVQVAAELVARRLGMATGDLEQSAGYVQAFQLRLRDGASEGRLWAEATASRLADYLVGQAAGLAATADQVAGAGDWHACRHHGKLET